jgi:hypothetical protein
MRVVVVAEHRGRPAVSRRPRRPTLGAAGVVAAAGLAAVIVTAAFPGLAPKPVPAMTGSAPTSAAVLDRASLVAGRQSLPALEPGQFLYSETIVSMDIGMLGPKMTVNLVSGGTVKGRNFADCTMASQSWVASNGDTRTVVTPMPSRPGAAVPSICEVVAPEYSNNLTGVSTYLSPNATGLPTDPAALDQVLDSRFGAGRPDSEGLIMGVICRLLQQNQSPALRAALYLALERLPGMTNLGSGTDQLGRHGIALGLVQSGLRSELIVDPATLALLEAFEVVLASGSPHCIHSHTTNGIHVAGFCVTPARVGSVIDTTLYVTSGTVSSDTATVPGPAVSRGATG